MPVFEARITCLNNEACKKTQLIMKDFKNKSIKNELYDHIAVKNFSDWESAEKELDKIKDSLTGIIIDLEIVQK